MHVVSDCNSAEFIGVFVFIMYIPRNPQAAVVGNKADVFGKTDIIDYGYKVGLASELHVTDYITAAADFYPLFAPVRYGVFCNFNFIF